MPRNLFVEVKTTFELQNFENWQAFENPELQHIAIIINVESESDCAVHIRIKITSWVNNYESKIPMKEIIA